MSTLPASWRTWDTRREWIEERAAILEHDADLPRVEAEIAAAEQWTERQRRTET